MSSSVCIIYHLTSEINNVDQYKKIMCIFCQCYSIKKSSGVGRSFKNSEHQEVIIIFFRKIGDNLCLQANWQRLYHKFVQIQGYFLCLCHIYV